MTLKISKGTKSQPVVETFEITVARAAYDRCSEKRGQKLEKIVARTLEHLTNSNLIDADDLYYICNGQKGDGKWNIISSDS